MAAKAIQLAHESVLVLFSDLLQRGNRFQGQEAADYDTAQEVRRQIEALDSNNGGINVDL